MSGHAVTLGRDVGGTTCSADDRPPVRSPDLRLLGGFSLQHEGEELDVGSGGRRLLAFLAIDRRPLSRSLVAGSLWPDTSDARAGANLRTTLWRLRHLPPVVVAGPEALALHPSVTVDTHRLESSARALIDVHGPIDPAALEVETFTGELLPELCESWLVFERERLRQVSLHALEALSRRLSAEGRHAAAVLAGMAAVEAEPLRESANRALVEAHLAEDNVVEALRHYRWFEELLARELGVRPHADFAARLGSLTTV